MRIDLLSGLKANALVLENGSLSGAPRGLLVAASQSWVLPTTVTRVLQSGLKAAPPACSTIGGRGLPTYLPREASHSRAGRSLPPIRAIRLSGLIQIQAPLRTFAGDSRNGFSSPASHRQTAPSSLAVRMVWPSGLKATAWTLPRCCIGAPSGAAQVVVSQTRTV